MPYLEPEIVYRVQARSKKERNTLRRIFELYVQNLETSIYPDIEMYYKATTTYRKAKPTPINLYYDRLNR